MTKPQSNQKSLVIVGIILSIVVVIGISWAITHNNKKETKRKDDERTSSENKSTSISKSISEATSPINFLAKTKGLTFTGSNTQILTAALVFPTASLSFDSQDGFKLVADGLNLSLLGDPALEIQGSYPIVKATIAGSTSVANDNKTIDMKVKELSLSFSLNGNNLDAATSQKILSGVTAAGLILPTVNSQNTITVNVTTQSIDKDVVIKSSKESLYFISFTGKN